MIRLIQWLCRSPREALFKVLAFLLVAAIAAAPASRAATPNYNLNAMVQVIPIQISGQWTTTTTGVATFKIPFAARLVGVSATARASGGTTPTLTVDVKQGSTSVLSAPVSITAGSVAEATVTTSALTDEATISVNLAIGGSSPTWNDITVLLTVVRQ